MQLDTDQLVKLAKERNEEPNNDVAVLIPVTDTIHTAGWVGEEGRRGGIGLDKVMAMTKASQLGSAHIREGTRGQGVCTTPTLRGEQGDPGDKQTVTPAASFPCHEVSRFCSD